MPRRPQTFDLRPKACCRDDRKACCRDDRKAERDAFYSSARWMRLRAAFLRANPLCADCLARDVATVATVAHHVEERGLNPGRALDGTNLQALCSPCHTRLHKSRKSRAVEDPA